MKRKKIIIIALSLLYFICSCRQKQNKILTFTVGGAPSEVALWECLVKEFELQSGLKVNFLRQPTDTDQRRQGLIISLKAKKPDPDVFLMDVAWVAQFAASGWLEELDDYTQKNKTNLNVFFPKVLNLADQYEGKLIAFPVYVDGGLLYYRKDLLEKYGYPNPPFTWQELVEYAIKIQKEERKENSQFYGFVWQGAQYEGLTCTFLEFAASGGGGIIVDNEGIVFDSLQNLHALHYMYDLIHTYSISPPNTFTEMKEEEVRMFFQQGNALFERNWPYAWALHQSPNSQVKDKVGIFPLPYFSEGESVSTLGGWHIGISKYSDAKEESFRFISFVTSYINQKKLALQLGWNPARTDVYQDKELIEKMPHFASLREVFENAYARPPLPYYTLISEIVQRQVNSVLSDKVSPSEALSSGQIEIQEIVDRYEKK